MLRWESMAMRFMLPNLPAQAGRGDDVRLLTEVRSRPCLQPTCSTLFSYSALVKIGPAPGAEPDSIHAAVAFCSSTQLLAAGFAPRPGQEILPFAFLLKFV